MKNFKIILFFLLCFGGIVQGMEIEMVTIPKGQYGAVSQSKPLQEMFSPVGLGTDKIMNILLGENYYLFENRGKKLEFPADVWQQIWKYFDLKDKLNLGSVSNSFNHIRESILIIEYNQFFSNIPKLICFKLNDFGNSYKLNFYYKNTKAVCDIYENTKINEVKIRCKFFLENYKNRVQNFIDEAGSDIKTRRHRVKTDDYKKLKYLNEIFNEPNACFVSCLECRDEWCDDCLLRLKPCIEPCVCCCYCYPVCFICAMTLYDKCCVIQ